MPEPNPIYYTFGNHMHWVDMEWLWGYHVLPGSVRDMLALCREAGVKGNVNFDGIGYEKMAAEAPEALAELREAIRKGDIEPVGCSYGQPYGLFHGGESNVRQRIYGVRAVMRLLGFRPRTFWEEEFDFFPQLPQMLRGCGFTGGSLFFQWTWHTPEIPMEEEPVVLWEGADGSRLPVATRNRLNLHQWPEEFEGLLNELAASVQSASDVLASGNPKSAIRNPHSTPPLVLQWLELMPSPDWMCRSELLLPKLKELFADPRFDVHPCTLGEYLQAFTEPNPQSQPPVRRYEMHQVWHGLTLGKNGDRMRRLSWQAEAELLEAETLAAVCGLFGRPYAQWDVYPVWELEEGWRSLLAAQHHDNDECEGLCGDVGVQSCENTRRYARRVLEAQVDSLERPAEGVLDRTAVFNQLGWTRTIPVRSGKETELFVDVPAFGFGVRQETAASVDTGSAEIEGSIATVRRGVVVATARVGLDPIPPLNVGTRIEVRLDQLRGVVGGKPVTSASIDDPDTECEANLLSFGGSISAEGYAASAFAFVSPAPELEAIDLSVHCHPLEGDLDPGMNAGWQLPFRPTFADVRVVADAPYSAFDVHASGSRTRKYPTGDWMTSPQWYEEIEHPFTSYSFVDFLDEDGSGVLVLHNGSQQWLLDERGARVVLGVVDPWDGDKATSDVEAKFRIVPHAPIEHSQRHRLAAEFRANTRTYRAGAIAEAGGDYRLSFSGLDCRPTNVLVTAFYREAEDYSGRDLENYAGRGMGYPYVLRLVEFDGVACEAEVTLPGPIAKAFKTNLLGEIETELKPLKAEPSPGNGPEAAAMFTWQKLTFPMRANEIATLYVDLVPGRKQVRDLDAKRKVWAKAHKRDPTA